MEVAFSVTPNAAVHIQKILETEAQGSRFRISVQGGGCSGFQYNFLIDRQTKFHFKVFIIYIKSHLNYNLLITLWSWVSLRSYLICLYYQQFSSKFLFYHFLKARHFFFYYLTIYLAA